MVSSTVLTFIVIPAICAIVKGFGLRNPVAAGVRPVKPKEIDTAATA